MGTKFPYLVFLYWFFTVQANVTLTDDCEEQLLIADDDKLFQLCLTTQETQNLAVGYFEIISYNPRGGGTIVAHQWSELVTFVQKDSSNATWTPQTVMDLASQPPPCYEESSTEIGGMAIDWVTGIVFATHDQCGRIRAYDLKRSFFSTVYEDSDDPPNSIATYSQGGLLVWVQRTCIRRAFQDGTEVKVLANVPKHSTGDVAVDQKTSLVYWTNKKTSEIFQCDIEGNKRRRLNLLVQGEIMIRGFAVLNNIIFWQDDSSGSYAVYRADVRKPAKRQVYHAAFQQRLEILPRRADFDDGVENPCANNSCSHICVQSNSHMRHTCLCPDDYALDRGGHKCTLVRRHLLVSTTTEGIWQVPILNNTASERKLVVQNAPNAADVQFDKVRMKIFWSERGVKSTRIMEGDMENPEKYPQVVFEQHVALHLPPGALRLRQRPHLSLKLGNRFAELEAFAVDWITGNLYMAFHGRRRILACGRDTESGNYSKCAELFGNQVGSSIGGLALDPNEGTMYWAHTDEEDPAVVKGGMDGSWLEFLKRAGLVYPMSLALHKDFRVYWLDQGRQRFEYTDLDGKVRESFRSLKYAEYAPKRIFIDGENLYWVGRLNGSTFDAIFKTQLDSSGPQLQDYDENLLEMYVSRTFTDVTGLCMYDAESKWTRTINPCGKNHSCAGVCLLSAKDSFRCACPIGFESSGPCGSSCREIGDPTVFYSLSDLRGGKIMKKDGMKEDLVLSTEADKMAFDPVRGELFWCEYYPPPNSYDTRINGTFRLSLAEGHSGTTKAVPIPVPFEFEGPGEITSRSRTHQLEYDWIGENLYFMNWHRGVGLCSTATGECTIVVASSANFALDPNNGYMYWAHSGDLGVWKGEMDGSSASLIITEFRALSLAVDHTSNLLFWLSDVSAREVFHRSRLWMVFEGRGVTLSCDQETGDNLKMHELGQYGKVYDFLVITEPPQAETYKDPCIRGGLCSHMCIVTPSGYMRCLCPTAYKIMSDGWTCECADPNVCKTSNHDKTKALHPSRSRSSLKNVVPMVCLGNELPCVGLCLQVEKLCNGFADCPDFSDEGERCHEACKGEYGCFHGCSRSPAGPICFCPPDQVLASDNKSCVVLEFRTEKKWKFGLIMVGVVALILVMVVIVVTFKYRQTKRERDLTQEELDEFLRGGPAGASVAPDGIDRALHLPYTKFLSPDDIIIAKDTLLGSGEFGVVHPGIFKSEPVAIKVLKRSVDVDEFKAVLAEVKIMGYLGDHEFIVKFLGAEISNISKRKIMILTELSPEGDLLKYLWKVASVGLETTLGMSEDVTRNTFGVSKLTLYVWCEQIATGMEYLAQKQIVHGDLAARNVLVFKDNVVKIADFGLSKQLYGCSTYKIKRQRKLPWKWSAIELLRSLEFSEASDVWAFGVTAWEIFSLGRTPYKGMMMGYAFLQFIQAGNRLPKPEHASEEIYKVLLECWDSERNNRPNFHRLKEIFHDFVSVHPKFMEPELTAMESVYITAV